MFGSGPNSLCVWWNLFSAYASLHREEGSNITRGLKDAHMQISQFAALAFLIVNYSAESLAVVMKAPRKDAFPLISLLNN